jgi:tetratricopeptide (TPR) repeat protein
MELGKLRLLRNRSGVVCRLALGVALGGLPATAQVRPAPPRTVEARSPLTFQADEELFDTLCAVYAAGSRASGSSGAPTAEPADAALRQALLSAQGPATDALRNFYQTHLLASPDEVVSRYISYALVVGAPPSYPYLLEVDELPPDVLSLEGFTSVLAAFHKEAGLAAQWRRLQPLYDQQIAPIEGPVLKLTQIAAAYVREIQEPTATRSFRVIVEPMVGGRTQFRNYGDQYSVVIGSNGPAAMNKIRHAYLHYLLDPLPLKYGSLVASKRDILHYAAQAPRLPEVYKEDFTAFVTECFIKAVELRLDRLAPTDLEKDETQYDQDGYVLVRTFVAQLREFEKAEPAMSLYFGDMLRTIQIGPEEKRIEKIQYAAVQAAPENAEQERQAPSELQKWLREGNNAIAAQDGAQAAAAFERILAKYPDAPRALYGLALASAMQHDAQKASELFERVIQLSAEGSGEKVDSGVLAWSHVYLGRIHDVQGERDQAVAEYKAALAVDGAPQTAVAAAEQGAARGFAAASQKGSVKPN